MASSLRRRPPASHGVEILPAERKLFVVGDGAAALPHVRLAGAPLLFQLAAALRHVVDFDHEQRGAGAPDVVGRLVADRSTALGSSSTALDRQQLALRADVNLIERRRAIAASRRRTGGRTRRCRR